MTCCNLSTQEPDDTVSQALEEVSEAMFYLEHQIDDVLWGRRKTLSAEQKEYLESLKNRIDDIVTDIEANNV